MTPIGGKMTDRRVRQVRQVLVNAGYADYVPGLLTELLRYRDATRRLRRAWGKCGPLPGGPVTAAVLDVLAVEER